MDCDLKLSLSTNCPVWQKVEGSGAGQPGPQSVSEWWRPRQATWTERGNPSSFGRKPKGSPWKLQCAGLVGLGAIPKPGPKRGSSLGKGHGAGAAHPLKTPHCCRSSLLAELYRGCALSRSQPLSLPESHQNPSIQQQHHTNSSRVGWGRGRWGGRMGEGVGGWGREGAEPVQELTSLLLLLTA